MRESMKVIKRVLSKIWVDLPRCLQNIFEKGDIGDLAYMYKRPQVFLKPIFIHSFKLLSTFIESDSIVDTGFYRNKQNRSTQGVTFQRGETQ